MPVLQRSELESSPLADLHAIASELGLEGFRGMRRDDLIGAILGAQGGDEPEDAREPDEVPSDEALEPAFAGDTAEAGEEDGEGPEAVEPEDEAEPVTDEAEPVTDEAEPVTDEAEPVTDEAESVTDEGEQVVEEEPEVEDEVSDEEIATGVLDVLTNGSGFLRLDPAGQSRDDVYVSPAQIRRCELRAGDEVS